MEAVRPMVGDGGAIVGTVTEAVAKWWDDLGQ
jgi:hypothetical protein